MTNTQKVQLNILKEMADKQVITSIDYSTYEGLVEISKKEDRSIRKIVRRLITEHVKNYSY